MGYQFGDISKQIWNSSPLGIAVNTIKTGDWKGALTKAVNPIEALRDTANVIASPIGINDEQLARARAEEEALKSQQEKQAEEQFTLEEQAEQLEIEKEQKRAEEEQKELWAREDQIREHIEEREDTAYQRAVEDMRKAGINPELLGVSPASSGGGITQATAKDKTLENTKLSKQVEIFKQLIEQEFKGNEATKDRLLKLFQTIVTGASIVGAKAVLKK